MPIIFRKLSPAIAVAECSTWPVDISISRGALNYVFDFLKHKYVARFVRVTNKKLLVGSNKSSSKSLLEIDLI
jgi:hypothetical protein